MALGYLVHDYCYADANDAIASFNSYHDRWMGNTTNVAEIHAKTLTANGISIEVETYSTQGSKSTFLSGDYIPTCTLPNGVSGSIHQDVQFNPANLNPVDVVNAIGSGFILIALPLSVAWAGRRFLKAIFHT